MRALLLIPVLAFAAPVMAQAVPPAPSPYYVPPAKTQGVGDMGRVMSDPTLPETAGRMAGAVTRAVMNLPIGELAAAIEGRPVGPGDRQRTLGGEIGDAPGMDRAIERQVANGAGAVQASAQAMQRALPAILAALGQAAAEIDRAAANLPSPTYPRR